MWIANESLEDRMLRVHDAQLRWHGWESERLPSTSGAANFLMLIARRELEGVLDVSGLTPPWRQAFKRASDELIAQKVRAARVWDRAAAAETSW